MRNLAFLQGLTEDQRRTELGHRICNIAARLHVTHTNIVFWAIQLSHDNEPRARSSASVREVHHDAMSFLILTLTEQLTPRP